MRQVRKSPGIDGAVGLAEVPGAAAAAHRVGSGLRVQREREVAVRELHPCGEEKKTGGFRGKNEMKANQEKKLTMLTMQTHYAQRSAPPMADWGKDSF